ncbi:hypothetical protein EV643_110217 [Kribbella sp. VKM Ac-2527]|uniref:AMIN-like domain-containing protein n=1 Tax=Kribbella caucasensis TaxID=2512215 RepID=A0A4R6KA75_9ACTN|nr:hypothetical protein [Kribbella sp. VKM Ac-2527]TDO46834.1 hypothetical protein EV643_110217 [Kribbella sp. VKM Ac-2527]
MKSIHTIKTIRRPIRTAFAVLAVAAVPVGAVAVPAVAGANAAASSSTTCPTGWGSLPEANTRVSTATLEAVRTGRHACFDRVVFDIAGKPPGYTARYVSNVFRPGAGHLVPLRGGAKLEIMLGVREFDEAGHWAFQPTHESSVTGYRTFRQVEYAGSTEGAAWIGLGLRARLPFRVFTLAGPGAGSRIVVDVAHRW